MLEHPRPLSDSQSVSQAQILASLYVSTPHTLQSNPRRLSYSRLQWQGWCDAKSQPQPVSRSSSRRVLGLVKAVAQLLALRERQDGRGRAGV